MIGVGPTSSLRALHPFHRPSLFVTSILLLLSASACGSDSPSGPDGGGGPSDGVEIVDSVDVDLPVDSGEVGLVLDTRQYARRGYTPAAVSVTFPGQPDHNQTLDVDPVTNLAVLHLRTEELTPAEREAFGNGVAVDISVLDENQAPLGQHSESSQVLDDSNLPLVLPTTLPYLPRSLALRAEVPYLLQPEGESGVMTSTAADAYAPTGYLPDNPGQQFYFTPVDGAADPNTYVIEHRAGYGEGTYFYVTAPDGWVSLNGNLTPLPAEGPQHFVLEQDDEGWLRIRVAGTTDYIRTSTEAGGIMEAVAGTGTRFRLISDDIAWTVVDRGTVFHDPITPPARLDFAYQATIRNCSDATLTEVVGRAESRSTTATVSSSESLQLFSSDELSTGVTVSAEVGGGVPLVGEVTGSASSTMSYSYTTSQTTSTENTMSSTSESSTEVSRSRELALPPHTAVEVYDAVRTISGVRIPFSQVLRISGTYKDDGSPLTGQEILSQMLFNFVTGVPTQIGDSFVDISLRGRMEIDQLLKAQTDANDLPGACD